jgi:hypothetical protein
MYNQLYNNGNYKVKTLIGRYALVLVLLRENVSILITWCLWITKHL